MITFVITHTSPSEEYEKLVRHWIMIESDGQKDRQIGANRDREARKYSQKRQT
jgi:hypothetical protein